MGYKSTKRTMRGNFLRFEEGTPKTLLVSDWDFTKHPSGYLFRCYVKTEDGEAVDKIWTVWDYESAQTLKKKLKVKCLGDEKELTVTMERNEDGDATFTLS